MKPILCPCCNRKFAKQETLLRHLNTAHRGKAGTGTGSSTVGESQPNFSLPQEEDKHDTVVTIANNVSTADYNDNCKDTSGSNLNDSSSNNGNISTALQKNAQVASLQAIQTALCKDPQPVDPSSTSSSSLADHPKEESAQTCVGS